MAARQYNIKKFFRAAPNALLARYFKKHKALGDFDFKALKEGNPDPLVAAWLTLPDKQRAKMEAEFQDIYALSCQPGVKAIMDEARYWIVTVDGEPFEPFMDWLAGLKNDADRAFQTFMKHPKFWKGATNFFHADSLSWWRKRKGMPKAAAQCDDASLDELSDKIIKYFHYEEGKGTNCTVEPFRRNDLDYFFAYPEDYSQRGIEWVKGEIKPRPHNPIFEVIFVYSETYGTLDINYKGDRKALKPLQRYFSEAILKHELPPEPKDNRVYILNPLVNGFTPRFDPGSGIEDVRVTKLRLSSFRKPGDRINLEADSEENPNAVYELLEKVSKGLPMRYFNVARVDFQASVIEDPTKPAIPVKFHVTHPNSSNLKYDRIGRLLRGMLEKSGIEHKEPDPEKDDG